MKEEQRVEMIYDLVEKYDFENLTESDKKFVLENSSMEEYNDLRLTITDTKELFSNYPFDERKVKQFSLKRIANYPIEIYKIAAAILFLISISFILSKWQTSTHSNLIALADTVFVEKTDTVFIEVRDTVEKIVTIKSSTDEDERVFPPIIAKIYIPESNCSIEICPDDIQKLSSIGSKNNFSKEKQLTDFLVTIN